MTGGKLEESENKQITTYTVLKIYKISSSTSFLQNFEKAFLLPSMSENVIYLDFICIWLARILRLILPFNSVQTIAFVVFGFSFPFMFLITLIYAWPRLHPSFKLCGCQMSLWECSGFQMPSKNNRKVKRQSNNAYYFFWKLEVSITRLMGLINVAIIVCFVLCNTLPASRPSLRHERFILRGKLQGLELIWVSE